MSPRRPRSTLLAIAALCLAAASPSLAADWSQRQAARATAAAARATRPVPAPAAARGASAAPAAPSPEVTAPKVTAQRLSAAEIVKRHVAARGGAKAWRAVQALSASGKLDAGTGDSVARSRSVGQASRRSARELAARKDEPAKQVQLPFTLAKQRPNRSRLEVAFAGKTAVQVYDGKQGWKVRPFLNRTDVEPFTPDEAKAEAEADDLDDPLIEHAAKGTKVAVDGVEAVDGRAAYKLALTSRSGAVRHVWIDARTFLDVKVEGAPRRMDGKLHEVWVYQRDFRTVDGVKIPFVLETAVDGYPGTHRISFEKVTLNPKLDAATFAKPKA